MSTATAETKNLEAPLGPLPAPAERAPVVLSPSKPKRRGKRAFLILGAVALAALAGVGIYVLVTRGTESTDDAQIEADVVPVAARVGGAVTSVPVVENQHVNKGDLLVQIDDADYVAKEKQAEADLAQAQAQQEQAESQEQIVAATAKGGMSSAQASVWGSSVSVQSADAQIAAGQAALARTQVEAKNAETELARAKDLRASNAIPQAQLDAAQTAADAARAALSQAQANVTFSQESKRLAVSHVAEAQGRLTQTAPIDAQIRVAHAATEFARAHVAASDAALSLAKLQLAYTKVYAPESGWLSKLMAHPGQLLSPMSPIAELVPEKTYVIANFKETQIGDMRPGQPADIAVDALPGQKFSGWIESLSAGTGARFSLLPADNASGNFIKVVQRVPVRVAFSGTADGALLRAGLSAQVTVHVR
jgi:membrane fusion protein (multidrug efflux system)